MTRTIRSGELGRKELWKLLGPHLKKHGRCAFTYATLQNGLSYYLTDDGYLSFVPARHWMMSPFGKKVVFCNPVCGPERYAALADEDDVLQRRQAGAHLLDLATVQRLGGDELRDGVGSIKEVAARRAVTIDEADQDTRRVGDGETLDLAIEPLSAVVGNQQ